MSFVRVKNERWHDGNVVLIGDAAHTAHFSIGSGTKLAMEDAIALARELSSGKPVGAALEAYEAERKTESLRLQNAARNSREWFEHVGRYMTLEPEQFAYSLLTRSQRVSHENLRLRDRAYLENVERWWAGKAAGNDRPGVRFPSPARRTTPVTRYLCAHPSHARGDEGRAVDVTAQVRLERRPLLGATAGWVGRPGAAAVRDGRAEGGPGASEVARGVRRVDRPGPGQGAGGPVPVGGGIRGRAAGGRRRRPGAVSTRHRLAARGTGLAALA